MSLSVGIVGLPNVGKSTLFNALLKQQAAYVANFPFATIEPNVGIVPVPDPRLEKLAHIVATSEDGMRQPSEVTLPPIVPATVKFVDIAGLIAGASKGEGLGNKFLAHIREMDAICHVVRVFTDPDIIKQGVVDPKSDFETVKTELGIADLEHPEAPSFALKSNIIALNVDEEDLKRAGELEKQYAQELGVADDQVIAICAKTEAELAGLSEEDQTAYLKDLGIGKSGLERLIVKAFTTLGLMTFLTAGEKEVRAWTVRLGCTALTASGTIHTDFVKKFIKADICKFNDFIESGGWKGAREKGLVRSESRDYVVCDGDIIEFKIGA